MSDRFKDDLYGNELLMMLDKKAIHGEKLVVLTGSQWNLLKNAYGSNLVSRIDEDALIFHPIIDVKTKEIFFRIDSYGGLHDQH